MIYRLWCFLAATWFKVCYRFRTEGEENLLFPGGALVAPNHGSFLDPMVVAAGTKRKITFLARGSLTEHWLYRLLTARIDIINIERGKGDREALRKIHDSLRGGAACLVFPEGTRSDDGRLGEIKKGVVMMARQAEVPVVPTFIRGSFEIWPRGQRFPSLRGRLLVRFGPPIDVAPLPKNEAVERVREGLLALGVEPGLREAPTTPEVGLRGGAD